MDRLEAMAVLLQAVEAGSLTGAGRRLGMPLATVSRKVAELEAHLKTQLLVRSNRRLALTGAGEAYVAAARRILDEVAEAERAAVGEFRAPKGELILTAPVAFGRLHVLPVVTAFLKVYPEIDVRLMLADRWISLVEDHVDLAVRLGALPDSSLVATRIGAIRRVVVGSPAYLAERGVPHAPAELAQHDCVSSTVLVGANAWTFAGGKAETSVPVHARLVVDTAEAAVDAAVAGAGLTRVLLYQAETALRAGALRIVLEEFEASPSPLHLLHAGGLLPLKLRAFIDFAAPRLRATLAGLEQIAA